MHLMKMISKDSNTEENKINGKAFEKKMMEEGANLPDKEPDDKKSEDKESRENKSEDKKTEDRKSGDKKSEDKKSEGKNSEDKTNKDKKSEDKESGDKKPESKKSEDKKPEDKKSEDKNSDDKKSEDKKSEDGKSEKNKSGDKKSGDDKDEKKDPKDKKTDKEKNEPVRLVGTDSAVSEKKSGVPFIVKLLLAIAGVIAVAYVAVTVFFLSHFSFNIYVNGIDVSLMGMNEANRCLCAQKGNDYKFLITASGNELASLTDKDLNSHYDYTNALSRLKEEESDFWWIPYLTYSRQYDIEPDLVFDETEARKTILELDPVKHTPSEHKSSVNIQKSSQNGYILISTEEKQPDQNKLVNTIIAFMHGLSPYMDLDNTDYDVDIPYTELQRESVELFDKIDAIQNTKIVFSDLGQEVQVDKDTIADFLRTDGQGRFIVDKEGYPTLDQDRIDKYSEDVIGTAFTSKDTNMWWHKYNGGTVSVNSGTYGKTVDTEAVSSRIYRLLEKTEDYEGPPDYAVDPDRDPNAPDEIGDTYIEVDMTRQKLYYIKDGKLFMTSDVVTGNKGRHHDTTQLMAYIYFMQRDRVLVGEDYRTPVKYWMAFHNHEGLHDASWRRSFGGDIYKYNGSHGCVNLPTSFAAELYDNVYVGLPVITYY